MIVRNFAITAADILQVEFTSELCHKQLNVHLTRSFLVCLRNIYFLILVKNKLL